jgi:hypothetical protein
LQRPQVIWDQVRVTCTPRTMSWALVHVICTARHLILLAAGTCALRIGARGCTICTICTFSHEVLRAPSRRKSRCHHVSSV